MYNKKKLQKKVILIDRFVDSTIAYQHFGMGINKKFINYINNFILKNVSPDFTFLNIVNMKNLKIRVNKRSKKNRYDNFKIDFYKKVQSGYLRLSKNNKKYLIIDSNKSIIENKKKIINKVNSILIK